MFDGGKGDDFFKGAFSAQGMGWNGGLGVLANKEGNDTYYSEWYSLGAAAHLGFGSFFDYSGDDRYCVLNTQGLGSASDFSIASFIDKGGNDTYIFKDDSCGAGVNNAIAYFIDERGRDRYSNDSMGRGAVYDYDEKNGISLGIFYDAEEEDNYLKNTSNAKNNYFDKDSIIRKPSDLRRGIFKDNLE